MGIKKFIKNAKQSLGLHDCETEGKKKKLKALLKKLRERKKSITRSLEASLGKKEKKDLEEELKIVSLQIKKGKNILHELYS